MDAIFSIKHFSFWGSKALTLSTNIINPLKKGSDAAVVVELSVNFFTGKFFCLSAENVFGVFRAQGILGVEEVFRTEKVFRSENVFGQKLSIGVCFKFFSNLFLGSKLPEKCLNLQNARIRAVNCPKKKTLRITFAH